MKTAVLALSLSLLGSVSHASSAAQPLAGVPNSNPVPFSGVLSFYGSSSYFVEVSTPVDSPTLVASGSGYLYGVDCSSGTLGDYLMVFDSSFTAGVTIATRGKALTPQIQTGGFTSASTVISNSVTGGSTTLVNAMDTVALISTATASGLPVTSATTATTTNTSCLGACGQYVPPGGSKRFFKGLVVVKHGTGGQNCLVSALTDAEIAAGTH